MSEFSDAAADLHAAFADPILYTGAGLNGASITGTKYDVAGAAFQGDGETARHVWFEIQQHDLPQEPGRDKIVHLDPMTGQTTVWRVTDKKRRDDIGAWDLTVEAE